MSTTGQDQRQPSEGDLTARVAGSQAARPTVEQFATTWLEQKREAVDLYTFRGYEAALRAHALKHPLENGMTLGSMFFHDLRAVHVQSSVNAEIEARDAVGQPIYAPQTVHAWFRAFRTMTRAAVKELGLDVDASLSIAFPELSSTKTGENQLSVAELQPFLDELRIQAPQHYALTCMLAWTGLRFSQVSPLKWDDIEGDLLHVRRKNTHGVVRDLGGRDRAVTVPIDPELAKVLQWHLRRLEQIAAGAERVGAWAREGLETGWVFPARGARRDESAAVGPVNSSTSLKKSWDKTVQALQDAGRLGGERFTVHGLRRTFRQLLRQSGAAPGVEEELTGETKQSRRLDVDVEKVRDALAGVRKLVKRASQAKMTKRTPPASNKPAPGKKPAASRKAGARRKPKGGRKK